MKIGDERKIRCPQCGKEHAFTIVSHNSDSQSYLAQATCPKVVGVVSQQLSTIL